MNYETEYWEAQQFIDWLHRPEVEDGTIFFISSTMTHEEYKDYLASLEEQERLENEER
jgi:hypothetical protein